MLDTGHTTAAIKSHLLRPLNNMLLQENTGERAQHQENDFTHFICFCLILVIFYSETFVHSPLARRTPLSGPSPLPQASFPPCIEVVFHFESNCFFGL